MWYSLSADHVITIGTSSDPANLDADKVFNDLDVLLSLLRQGVKGLDGRCRRVPALEFAVCTDVD